MSHSILRHLAAQPAAPLLSDPEEVRGRYSHWRVRVMYSMFVGYAVFYFCRKNLSAATPALIRDLGFSKTEIGSIWSGLYIAYGVSKLVNGVLGDMANPRYFMAIGLVLSALMNVFFGLSSSLTALGVLWMLNGWFQGMGWPPCARLLTQWYSFNERGTKWAIWNTAHQVGGGLTLILGGLLTQRYGWRSSFFVPAAIAIACSLFLIERLRDTPESLGLPSIEKYRDDFPPNRESGERAKERGAWDILVREVLCNSQIWLLSLGNFFVYVVRYGAMDWAPTFLVEVKHSTIAGAAAKTALFEFLGIAGALLAGRLSDTVFKGRRALVSAAYMFVLIFAVVELWWIPPGHPLLDAAALSAIGFLVYGPQLLVGVCAADAVHKGAAATATGTTGLFGYLGSVASGVGTGWIVDRYGWNGGFAFFVLSAFLGTLLFWIEARRRR